MAGETTSQEKTEAPTPRRLQEAREKGDIAKSQEVPSAAILLAGMLSLYVLSSYMLDRLYGILRYYLGNLHVLEIAPGNMTMVARNCMLYTASVMAPVMAVIVVTAVTANYAQVGAVFSTEKITPKLEKINPIKGLSNLFSKQTLAQSVKSIAKLVIIGYVAYSEVNKAMPLILPLMDQEPLQILTFVAHVSFWIFLKSVLIVALLAGADYLFQRWQFLEKMKMTKQEVKEEAKQTEGDPHVKGRIRSIQMEMARKRMMSEVPTADVIITNPTHLAIALRYDNKTMMAPKLIAKGAGVIAHRIKELAAEHGVPLVENKPLARALYKAVDLDATIPENLFQAVAEVLAYVYSLKQRTA